ncbi:hypothetical protein GCM10010300_55540 [Streptomyces olivaceoviridis]|uniref:hypothetical protein n=1 Tax=Streptomyces olivaceoviridis TaxID=1921 RepID=UPI00198E52AD|nr:hypothetical protein [Streptomyces olivaceoviridis]GGZ04530.1 hypothetical protein GCM10010300_55540 [Streptomyces olivaceoviridis]
MHPHERTASEITALWRDPSLRPSVPADAGRRGRPLWPLALVLAAGWTAALLFLW